MPGLYTEPTARAQPTHDPKCQGLTQQNDRQVETGGNQTGAVSYAYQIKCPNDQNLVAVLGRANGKGSDPQPPLDERRGIPNLGPCIRCNVQMEGSGVGPDDVIVDAGRVASGDGGPIGAKKDVAIRADRADGFVLRNVKVRHAAEHGIYVLEADGYAARALQGDLQRRVRRADLRGGPRRDAGLRGRGQRRLGRSTRARPRRPASRARRAGDATTRRSRRCDSHHNASGYSGTAANAVHIHHNDFYDNALGFTTDVFTAAGHPGFPQDSDLIENNNFYSNNFNPYVKGSDVEPTVPVPVGTGLWIAGGNNNTIRNNRFWDNWRRGTMIFAVPDSTVCAPPEHQAGCDPAKVSTSFRNKTYGNMMGRDPERAARPQRRGLLVGQLRGQHQQLLVRQQRPGRHRGQHRRATPGSLPSNCATSMGTGGPAQEAELRACLADFSVSPGATGGCPWFEQAAGAASSAALAGARARGLPRATSPRAPAPRVRAPAIGRAAPARRLRRLERGRPGDSAAHTIGDLRAFAGGPTGGVRAQRRHAPRRPGLQGARQLPAGRTSRAASSSTSSTRARPRFHKLRAGVARLRHIGVAGGHSSQSPRASPSGSRAQEEAALSPLAARSYPAAARAPRGGLAPPHAVPARPRPDRAHARRSAASSTRRRCSSPRRATTTAPA